MIRKSWLLLATLTVAALASVSNAATLMVEANQGGTYAPGDTVTLTVTGDSEGASTTGIFGRLLFDNPAIGNLDGQMATQTTLLALGSIPWLVGTSDCTASTCNMFNQVGAFGATPAPASNLLVSTVSFVAGPPGTTANVSWEMDLGTGFALDFFGITSSPGLTLTVIPEPTTAALLGLGLFGLAAAGRRRA